jgi:hypothetical protein
MLFVAKFVVFVATDPKALIFLLWLHMGELWESSLIFSLRLGLRRGSQYPGRVMARD